MKSFQIIYNPYTNRIHFRQASSTSGEGSLKWSEIESDSSFLRFQKHRCIFENCAEEILDLINRYINSSGELRIDFIGTVEDFAVLKYAVAKSEDPRANGIVCNHVEVYPSSGDALSSIKSAYDRIKAEFDDYIDNEELDEDDERSIIGQSVIKFQETVSEEIPVCVIGNYSVGKSALVNALIGREILPSHANSTTAKNVQIRNSRSFRLCFRYESSNYEITFSGGEHKVECDGVESHELIRELTAGIQRLDSEEKIIHQIIENLNTQASSDSLLARIDSTIEVYLPFRGSELDTDNYSFVFIDTPGSNNGDEAQQIHRDNLEHLMDEQTNALPIFVMSRNSLDSNDTNDLKTLLEKKEIGFAIQNCIIAISMADQLVEQQLSEEMPEKIKHWLSHPTIMYVSPVAAIGEKKADRTVWIDQAYRQIFEKKLGDIIELCPPRYNETPCGRAISETRIEEISALLYASGLPSLETEINYYASRFAEFKKCTNGRDYLIEALDIADKKLQEAKDQLEIDRRAKIQEQNLLKKKLQDRINGIPLPSVNAVMNSVTNRYNAVLDTYCSKVESVVRATWENYCDKKNGMDQFEEAMTRHCQTYLYDAHIKQIQEDIERQFVESAAHYMEEIKKCVTDEYSKLSDAARKELDALFRDNARGPVFQNVPVGAFQRIKATIRKIMGSIKIGFTQEMFIKGYSKAFCEKIRGTEKKYGVFVIQCIRQPARKFSEQITNWSTAYKASIDETLNKDNAILSKLDEKIKTMEDIITDMEQRLKNLMSTRSILESVIPDSSEEM